MNKDVIIACDFKCKEDLYEFLKPFDGLHPMLKIGMEIFYKEGPSLVLDLKAKGFKIFLDLKLHDIPNTVYKAMKNLASLGVDITNVHAAGGIQMMSEAKRGLIEGAVGGNVPKLIAVTQLTSTSEDMMHEELLIPGNIKEVVKHYASNAKKAGLDGIVCSPLEAPVANELGIISVTPGIRFADDAKNDQKRVATPAFAKELGATYIVVGRSITASSDPVASYKRCLEEFL